MSLSDIKRKLYKKEEDKDLSAHEVSEYNPEKSSILKDATGRPVDAWSKDAPDLELEEKKQKSLRMGATALGIIVFIIIFMSAFFIYRVTMFSEDRVVTEISGPTDAGSGKLLTYTIDYDNNNRSDLNNVTLKVSYPENFSPEENPNFIIDGPTTGHWDLGTIKSHDKGKMILNARVYSPQGALVYLKTELSYAPSIFKSTYVNKGQLGINVTTSPISIELLAPQNVSSTDAVNYFITYHNNGSVDFDNLKIKVDYPDGFTFSRSDPQSLEANNIWYIGKVGPGKEGKITIFGKITGDRDAVKTVKAYVGSVENGEFVSYNEESANTRISSSPLSIAQTVNGLTDLSVDPNQVLNFAINFRNDGELGISDAIVTENIDSTVLDYSTLDMSSGYFDQGSKTITWKSSDYPELKTMEPGDSGSIQFSIKVKDVIPVGSANDKNFLISSVATIDSPDVPTPIHMNKIIAGNKIDVKLNTKLLLTTKGFNSDAAIPNMGPIPPKVNQVTSYTIHWAVTNTTNDMTGVKVEAVLPTGVVMTSKRLPDNANVKYDNRSNTITWEIGNLPAGTGILTPAKELVFQVAIKPSIDQVGREPDLIGPSTVTGTDYFTGVNLQLSNDKKTTYLLEDETLKGETGSHVVN